MSNKKEYIVIETDLGNYYGSVQFCKYWSDKDNDYRYVMELENWDRTNETVISKEMFEEAMKIFSEEEEQNG